jgi:hypothetical protein
MILADGTTVREADDLLQVVGDDSALARAARRSSSARYSWYGIDNGLGVATVGMVVYLVGQFHYRKVEQDERRAAFATYPEGLGERLAVCVDGMRVIACR